MTITLSWYMLPAFITFMWAVLTLIIAQKDDSPWVGGIFTLIFFLGGGFFTSLCWIVYLLMR